MADINEINTAAQAGTQGNAQVQADKATGKDPMASVNADFEERETKQRAQKMGMNYVNLLEVRINPDHLKIITEQEALQAEIVPFFKLGKKVRLALTHPTKQSTQAIIRKLKEQGYAINVNLASDTSLKHGLKSYEKIRSAEPITSENIISEEEIASFEQEIQNLSAIKQKLQNVTAEEALNYLSVGALKTGASDIHYQPEEGEVYVRFRIDGVLQDVLTLDKSTYAYVSNQLKYKAGMKLNVASVPQDGRYFFVVNQRKIDVRVSSIPTEYGESFVCRLLDSKQKSLSFNDLGFEGRNLEILKKSLTLPNGMVLVTGPTGSGKTTTLYGLLNAFNTPEKKIITLEDPIEYHLSGITQSQINEKRGYTFASGLKAILRQDPDVVMLGEIRDKDTAETGAQAALTGHILLSTLHTNSAIETIPRLLNIGLEPYMIAPALSIVVAQRLIRKICPYCAVQKPISQSEQTQLQKIQANLPVSLPHGEGCQKCSHTGYLGQLSISEMFETSEALKQLILNGASTAQLFEQVRSEGMVTMIEDGLSKVLQGITTLEEVERVTRLSINQEEQNAHPDAAEADPSAPIQTT